MVDFSKYQKKEALEEENILEKFKKYKKIVNRLLDGENISENDYAYITRDN